MTFRVCIPRVPTGGSRQPKTEDRNYAEKTLRDGILNDAGRGAGIVAIDNGSWSSAELHSFPHGSARYRCRDGVAALIIGVGGFLGMGEREVAVAYESLRMTRDQNNATIITMNTSKDALRAAPAWT